jgi:hypothetical protein
MTENQAVAGGAATTADAGSGVSAAEGGPLRRGAAAGYRWLLLVFVVAGAVQIFLAGLGIFHHHSVGLGPHRALGFAMGGAAVVILVLAVVARPGSRAITGAIVLVVQTDLLQSLLAGLGDDAAVWGGLHALDGLAAIAVAWYLYDRARNGERGGHVRGDG